MNNDTHEIQDVLDRYATALRTADASLAASVYAESGVFYPYNLPTATGPDELLTSYSAIFNTIKLDVAFTVHEIVVDGELAFATTTSSGTVTVLADQSSSAEHNREVFVFVRTNGEWKIGRYMFNKATAPGA